MIEQKKEEGWEFLFLGANIDAAAEATRIGIDRDRAATYVADSIGNAVMYDAVCEETVRMRKYSRSPLQGPRGAWKRKIEKDTANRSH